MNNDILKNTIDKALPRPSEPAPREALWQAIQKQLPEVTSTPVQTGSKWRFKLAGFITVTALVVVSLLLFQRSPPVDIPGLQVSVGSDHLVWLQTYQPDLLEQNRPALAALEQASLEIQQDLQSRPGDPLLARRLNYYRQWRTEMLASLVEASRDQDPHVQG